MWWLISIISFLLLLVIYLLSAPFIIEINTINDLYQLSFHRLAHGRLILNEESLFIILKIAWWQISFDLLKPPKKRKKKRTKKTPVRKHISPSKNQKKVRKIIAVIKSCKLRKCHILLDTGHMPLNAILYPWCYILNSSVHKTIMINFSGENEIVLEVRNTLARAAWAFMRK